MVEQIVIIALLLFILCSPGVILTFPPNSGSNLFFSRDTNIAAVIVAAVIFGALFSYFKKKLGYNKSILNL